MSQQVLTPRTTNELVTVALKAGYIEHAQNFPVVLEVPTGFMFVARNENDGTWLVSKFWTDTNNWAYQPYFEHDDFNVAVARLQELHAEKLQSIL